MYYFLILDAQHWLLLTLTFKYLYVSRTNLKRRNGPKLELRVAQLF